MATVKCSSFKETTIGQWFGSHVKSHGPGGNLKVQVLNCSIASLPLRVPFTFLLLLCFLTWVVLVIWLASKLVYFVGLQNLQLCSSSSRTSNFLSLVVFLFLAKFSIFFLSPRRKTKPFLFSSLLAAFAWQLENSTSLSYAKKVGNKSG